MSECEEERELWKIAKVQVRYLSKAQGQIQKCEVVKEEENASSAPSLIPQLATQTRYIITIIKLVPTYNGIDSGCTGAHPLDSPHFLNSICGRK